MINKFIKFKVIVITRQIANKIIKSLIKKDFL